jgi:hypothetical protein
MENVSRNILLGLRRRREHFQKYYHICPAICQLHLDVLNKAINEQERSTK